MQCMLRTAGGERGPGTPAEGLGRGGASGAGRLSAQAPVQTPRAATGRRPQSSPGRGSRSSEFEPRSRSALVLATRALGPPYASPRQSLRITLSLPPECR